MADYPEIPNLPPAPIRSQPEEDYARTASTFVGALPPWAQAVNAAGVWMQGVLASVQSLFTDTEQAASTATNAASSAAQSTSEAEGWAQQSNAFAQVASTNANFIGNWDELTGPVEVPASVYWQGAYWQLLRDLPDITASEPGQTQDWAGTQTEIIAWEPVTGDATLASNRYYAVNFAPGQELTLPAAPANNDTIRIYKRSGNANGAILRRNGKTIMGLAQDMTIDGDIVGLQLIYTGSDWRITR